MDKKDVLRKVRIERNDDREEHIKLKAFKIGWLGVSAVMLLLICFRAFHNEPSTDIMMILLTQIASGAFYQYINMPYKKSYLYTGIFGVIGFLLSIAALLSQYGVY